MAGVSAAELRAEVSDAIRYAHTRLNTNATRTYEASAFLYALVELLSEKGLITIEDLDARKEVVGERLTQQYRAKALGVMLQDPEIDKYTYSEVAEVDCASKLHLCKAACCRLPFALSRQDLSERVVHWDLGRPYLIAQGTNSYCVHLSCETKQCTIREQRPLPCRAYDCRKDPRIWVDFDAGIPNSDILREDWPAPVDEDGKNQ